MYSKSVRQNLILAVALPVLLFGISGISAASVPDAAAQAESGQQLAGLEGKIRHELLMLPYYGVFDFLTFALEEGDMVTLTGQVAWAPLKTDAENAVRRIPGVRKVVNKIEILPLSAFDNAVRRAAFFAIFSRPGFEKYAIQAAPPIRIIVKNGHLTLDGVVGSKMDKTMAFLAASSVNGLFSITDNLTVD